MNRKSRILLKSLIGHYHSGQVEALTKFLPEKEASALEKIGEAPLDLSTLCPPGGKGISFFHYSWLVPALQKLSKPLQPLCLSSLPPKKGALVAGMARMRMPKSRPQAKVRGLVLDLLYQELINPKVLPRGLLPETEFSPLLQLKKNQLVDLIDYLGIHDLASSMRHVVDKERIQQILTALSPKKRNYLKQCLRSKNPLKAPDMKLKGWDGDAKKLEVQLQIRGLTRLATALSGQDPSLLWHLAHQLDIGRGRSLMRQVGPKDIPGVSPFLCSQVQNIVRYMST